MVSVCRIKHMLSMVPEGATRRYGKKLLMLKILYLNLLRPMSLIIWANWVAPAGKNLLTPKNQGLTFASKAAGGI
jgi:hypothetical protein